MAMPKHKQTAESTQPCGLQWQCTQAVRTMKLYGYTAHLARDYMHFETSFCAYCSGVCVCVCCICARARPIQFDIHILYHKTAAVNEYVAR